MAKICTLFSGSSGNCTYISAGGDAILIDTGVSCKQILGALEKNLIPKEQIKAIFITHSHIDHTKGLRVLLKKINVPVYATKETLGQLIKENTFSENNKYYNIEEKPSMPFSLKVEYFKTNHDCVGSVGYIVHLPDGEKVGVCTDLGKITCEIRECLQGCKAVVIEANHDVGMLSNGSYPFSLKQRILSEEGHLSNVSCAEELPFLIKNGAVNIVLAHLSKENNTPDLARVTAESVLVENGYVKDKDYTLYIAPASNGKMIYI